jgi:ankyrin repeat protein
MKNAIYRGHIKILEYALDNNLPHNIDICMHAASNGRFDMLQLLLNKFGDEPSVKDWNNKYLCAYAAGGGDLTILKWLIKNNYGVNNLVCMFAARFGHLDVLQWLRKHNYTWDDSVAIESAYGGHLEVLQWAIANGCSYNKKDLYNYKKDVRQWIQDNIV